MVHSGVMGPPGASPLAFSARRRSTHRRRRQLSRSTTQSSVRTAAVVHARLTVCPTRLELQSLTILTVRPIELHRLEMVWRSPDAGEVPSDVRYAPARTLASSSVRVDRFLSSDTQITASTRRSGHARQSATRLRAPLARARHVTFACCSLSRVAGKNIGLYASVFRRRRAAVHLGRGRIAVT